MKWLTTLSVSSTSSLAIALCVARAWYLVVVPKAVTQFLLFQACCTTTGSSHRYNRNPYEGYERTKRLYFRVDEKSSLSIHPKAKMMGVRIGEQSKAYLFEDLETQAKSNFDDKIGETDIRIIWNASAKAASVEGRNGSVLPSTESFWFAWYAFFPDTLIYVP
jgi:hypothetical protein